MAGYGKKLYSTKLQNKYGRNLNLSSFSVAELEKIAKDVQREANRRFDVATGRKPMMGTNAYKEFVKSGGKISLSHWEQDLGISRRKYLGQEIRRGLKYLDRQTSSYKGFNEWEKRQFDQASAAYVQAGGKDLPGFQRLISSDPARFWELVRAYKEQNEDMYMVRGSDVVVASAYEVINRMYGQDIADTLDILDEYMFEMETDPDPDLDRIIADKMAGG